MPLMILEKIGNLTMMEENYYLISFIFSIEHLESDINTFLHI